MYRWFHRTQINKSEMKYEIRIKHVARMRWKFQLEKLKNIYIDWELEAATLIINI